jgi:hypothetical protein
LISQYFAIHEILILSEYQNKSKILILKNAAHRAMLDDMLWVVLRGGARVSIKFSGTYQDLKDKKQSRMALLFMGKANSILMLRPLFVLFVL